MIDLRPETKLGITVKDGELVSVNEFIYAVILYVPVDIGVKESV